MPSGPIKTVFEDYAGDAIPNNGKKGANAIYDEYKGIAPGDSATPTALGLPLTCVDIPTSGGDTEIY